MICILLIIILSAGNEKIIAQTGKILPRITIKNGQFVREEMHLVHKGAMRLFQPRGFNYIRLDKAKGWHSTFGPTWYDPEQAEAMFCRLKNHGFNIVRVFIDYQLKRGVVATKDSKGLSPAYMANFFDFLKRAGLHGIYVVPTFPYLPPTEYYLALTGRKSKKVFNPNIFYLDEEYINAKARYIADFVRAVKDHNPDLLNNIFAFELENETHFRIDCPPFSSGRGSFKSPGGKAFDLGDPGQLQQLADDAVVYWADYCCKAIRRVDPESLVAADVFTFHAVGRSGPGKLKTDKTHDPRFPARPLALARSGINYLDIHLYPFNKSTLDLDLKSIEFEAVKTQCVKNGKPIIMGEFGAFKKNYKTPGIAAKAMVNHLRRVYKNGFSGFMYWTYDCDEQKRLWNGKSGNWLILDELARVKQP